MDLYIIKVKTDLDKTLNKETLRMAEQLRAKKEIELNSGSTDVIPNYRRKVNFMEYFHSFINTYTNKDKRLVISCYKKFLAFIGKDVLPCYELTENKVRMFKDYLESNLNGETPANYYKKFRKVMKYALNDGLFIKDPTIGIKVKKVEGVKKEILSMDEVQQLAQTDCGNETIKRAFLFCCVTGLRYCDVKVLDWDKISGDVLSIIQLKTNRRVRVNLNSTAISSLPGSISKKGIIFDLPSSTSCNKVLKTWAKKARINKTITWHCARHTFGTNLVIYGSDLTSASSLLGHATTRETEKYVRIVESLKNQAVFNLPEIRLPENVL